MSSAAIVIVGAGPAGLSCARSYRSHGGRDRVVLIGEEPDPPYERPPLTKELLRGEIGRDSLAIEEDGFYARERIELLSSRRVVALDPERRAVELADGGTLEYGACVLATGSRPALPPLPGIDHPSVHTLRRVGDCERLRSSTAGDERVLVVGSGFIGCETAISLAGGGAQVTLATMETRPQEARLGPDVGERIAGWLRAAGVELLGEVSLEAIEDREGHALARLSANEVEAEVIVAAMGVERNAELATDAGIELVDGRVPTDERMRTAADGVLAVGDLALAHNAAAGRHLAVEHWGEALRQGEIAGAALAGEGERRWESAPGFWSGLGERTIKQVAWGDGFDRVEITEHGEEAFTARYARDGELVGVLTHEADEDYEAGRGLVEARTAWT